VLAILEQKYTDLKTTNNKSLILNSLFFVELYAYILNRLRTHFERYIRSPQWGDLVQEVGRQRQNMDILILASLISN
jgi:hypothetical protein